VPRDAATILSWGADYKHATIEIDELRSRLTSADRSWTARQAALTDARQQALAVTVLNQLRKAEFNAIHWGPGGDEYTAGDGRGLAFVGSDWTGGDISLDYQMICGRALPN